MAKPGIIATIEPQKRNAMMRMAEAEKRTDHVQAASLVRQVSEHAGLMQPTPTPSENPQ